MPVHNYVLNFPDKKDFTELEREAKKVGWSVKSILLWLVKNRKKLYTGDEVMSAALKK